MFRPLLFALVLIPATLRAQGDALAHLDQARTAYLQNDLVLAHAHADSALALESDIPGGYKLRGDIRQRQNNLHGALLDYTKAEKVDPDDARLYVSRSSIHITEGRLKDAMRDLDKGIKLAPNDPDLWYNRACANYLGQNNDATLKDLERSLQLRAENADALFLRGVVKGELFKETSGLEDIEAAIRMKPDIAGGKMSAAVLLYELERFDEAITRLTEVIAEEGDELKEALYYRADCHYQLGNKEDACADWRRSAGLGEKDAQFIVRNYCQTDAAKIPKKPQRDRRKTTIEF